MRLGFLGIGVNGSKLGVLTGAIDLAGLGLVLLAIGVGLTFWLVVLGVWGSCSLGSSTGGLKGIGAAIGGLTIGDRSGDGINIGLFETESLPGAAGFLVAAAGICPGCLVVAGLGTTEDGVAIRSGLAPSLTGGVVFRSMVLSIFSGTAGG